MQRQREVTIKDYMRLKNLSYQKARKILNEMVKNGTATVCVRHHYEYTTVPGLGRRFGGSIGMIRRINYYTITISDNHPVIWKSVTHSEDK